MGLGAPGLLVHQSLETLLGLHQRHVFFIPLRIQLSDAPLRPRDQLATLVDSDFHRCFFRRCPWPSPLPSKPPRLALGNFPSHFQLVRSFGTLRLSPTPKNSLLMWTCLVTILGQWLRTWPPENMNPTKRDVHLLPSLAHHEKCD